MFNAPPFKTVSECLLVEGDDPDFFHEFGALDEIDPTLTLVIGDFGIGSDAPIALDYRLGPSPRVTYLYYEWAGDEVRTHWAVCSETFAAFSRALDLESVRWR